MAFTEKALIWVDVETTGLVAHQEHLLEIAILVTDLELNLLDEEGYQAVIWCPESIAPVLRDRADPFVQGMHDKTGLWDRLRDGKYAHVVQEEALAYIKRFVPEPKTARIAGNSVRLDLNFLEAHLPEVAAHLHYRLADVSSLVGFAHWWGGVPQFDKQMQHSAMADIRESIAEARYLREQVFGW